MLVSLKGLAEFKSVLNAYEKPEGGIPATDLTQAVQNALTAAGTALQPADLNTLNGKVAALEQLIEEDPEATTHAIDKFNEIVAFLNGITDTQTLEGIIAGINNSIAGKQTKITASGLLKGDGNGGVTAAVAGTDYVAPVSGKGLSTNDYDATAKAKVDAIPANPKYTDTTYDVATQSEAGLMSAADKTKLDGFVVASNTDIDAIFS